MSMYETRQNKEKVCRKIDTAGGARQRVKTGNKRKDLIQNIKLADNNHVSQLMAWVITRELNLGMSQSSNSESSSSRAPQGNAPAGSSHGSSDRSGGAVSSGITLSPTILPIVGSDSLTNTSSGHGSKHATSDHALDSENANVDLVPFNHIKQQHKVSIDLTNRNSIFGKVFNLKFHHRHILFNRSYKLPIVGTSNNIGYGGVLYSEKSLNGYQKNNRLTKNIREDIRLIQSIEKNKNFGDYNLLTNNCQHWVNKVYNDYKSE